VGRVIRRRHPPGRQPKFDNTYYTLIINL